MLLFLEAYYYNIKPAMNQEFQNNFMKSYHNLYNLHPQMNEDDFKFRYLKVDWFFPNHLHNVLIQIKRLQGLYFKNSVLEISLYGGLFHDAGLVYKRETPDALGHENRSVGYAENELLKLGYNNDYIEKVLECIKATEPSHNSNLREALLVRNADAYAHIVSMHFFAKANFSRNIPSFVNWFEDKLRLTYSKITIDDLKNEVEPLISYYEKMISNYRTRTSEDNFLDSLFG